MATFDDVLVRIGEFGLSQIVVYVLMGLVGIMNAFQTLQIVFVGGAHENWCMVPQLQNLTQQDQQYIAMAQDGNDYSRCQMFDLDYSSYTLQQFKSWDRSLYINTTTRPCDQYIFSTDQFLSTVISEYGLVCKRKFLVPTITTIYMSGVLVGSMIFGTMSDKRGRKFTLVTSLTVMVLGSILASVMPNYIGFVIMRFLVGASAGGSYTTAFVISMETIGPSYRMVAGICMQMWFAIGYIILPGFAYFLRDVMYLQLVLALCAAPFPILYFFILPEGPRWLTTNRKYEEAQTLLSKMAARNGRPLPEDFDLKTFLGEEEEDKTELEENKHATALDLLKRPNLRRISLNVFLVWFVSSLVYYGLSLSTKGGIPVTNIYLRAAVSGATEIPADILVCLVLDRIGRKIPLSTSMIVSGAACLAIIALQNHQIIWLLIFLSVLGKFGITAAFAIVYNYSAEVFPTIIRSVGIGAASMVARIGGLLAPQIGELDAFWEPLPLLIFGISGLVSGALVLLLPETLNAVLPETLEDGENLGKKNKIAALEMPQIMNENDGTSQGENGSINQIPTKN